MAVLLGALASVLIGIADFFGRYVTRRSNSVTATSTAFIGGVVVAATALLVIDSRWSVRDASMGAVSGLLIGLGLVLLYEAMAVSSAALAGPLVALGTTVLPLTWDLVFGRVPSLLTTLGILVAVPSLLLITASPNLRATRAAGVRLAAGSAVLVGSAFVFLGETDAGSGVWPAVTQRGGAVVVVAALAAGRRVPLLVGRRLLPLGLACGAFAGAAVVALALGLQRGSLGSVSVAGSMYPAVSATLAAAFDDDVLLHRQAVGIAGVIAGLALIALG